MNARNVTFDIIVQAVGAVSGLTRAQIMAEDRRSERATTRFVCWWLADKMLELGSSELGRLSGGRDHSSVLHGLARIKEMRVRQPEFRLQTDTLLATLEALERCGLLALGATIDPLATARRVLAAPEREAVRVSTYEIVAMARQLVALLGPDDEPTPSPFSKELEDAA